MRLAVTGGTGLVGTFLVEAALAAGHDILVLSRTAPAPGFFSAPVAHQDYDLDRAPPRFDPVPDALIHAAFHHSPGRYRGGEGDDPQGFLRRNLHGSLAVFDAAKAAGVARGLFVSSRAVYDGAPPGTALHEDRPCAPDSLYGQVKLQAEQGLAALQDQAFAPVSLRATGVYGPAAPGRAHKWTGLFADFLAGRPVAPRVATEVHGADLAAAVLLLLGLPAPQVAGRVFNLSDLVLDRHDLLAEVARLTGCPHALPERADAARVSVMATDRLQALGWRPGGRARLLATLPCLLA
ncbi:MAG: NAD-dependent epimerase/dehydratase family protein [Rhodothalassiaceae bacterium]